MLQMLRKRWPLFAALAIAAAALAISYRPGAVLGYFRDRASMLEIFTLHPDDPDGR